MPPSRGGRGVDWLIQHIPTPVLVNPERIAIKSGVALIGFTALVIIRPSSLNALLPTWIVYVWGATWLLGGVFGLAGYWLSRRPLEMAGHRLIVLGASMYAAAVAIIVGPAGYAAVFLSVIVAAPSLLRLLVAAGARYSRRSGR